MSSSNPVTAEILIASSLALFAMSCSSAVAGRVDRAGGLSGATSEPERRIALLIGNRRYAPSLGNLINPLNDVKLIADALRDLGFENIRIIENAARTELMKEINEYARRLRYSGDNAIGFFYYSGHGAANPADNRNYIIPTDVKRLDRTVWRNAVALETVVSKLYDADNAANFVIFDACRDLPPMKSTRKIKGFVAMRPRRGMFIGFSTGPGEPAIDVGDQSGPYAEALATYIRQPGMHHNDVFHGVKQRVLARTEIQLPWASDSLVDRVYFNGRKEAREMDIDSSDEATRFEVFAHAGIFANRSHTNEETMFDILEVDDAVWTAYGGARYRFWRFMWVEANIGVVQIKSTDTTISTGQAFGSPFETTGPRFGASILGQLTLWRPKPNSSLYSVPTLASQAVALSLGPTTQFSDGFYIGGTALLSIPWLDVRLDIGSFVGEDPGIALVVGPRVALF